MQILSICGIVIALLLLVVFCMRGMNIFIASIVCSLVAAGFSAMPLYEIMKGVYMPGFVSFMQSWFLLFFIGTAYGKLMEVTGAAESVANMILKIAGKKYALTALPIALGILVYGGINGFIAMFVAWPIMIQVFRETDVPRRLLPAMYFLGAGTFCSTYPGSPQILNVVSTSALGVSTMAAPLAGFISSTVMLVVGIFWFNKIAQKCKANGEHFNPEGLLDDIDTVESTEKRLPPGILAMLPIVVTVFAVNVQMNGKNVFPLEVALIVGCISVIVFNCKYMDWAKLMLHIGDAAKSALSMIGSTCAIVGFAYVVQGTPAFQSVIEMIPKLPGPPLVSLVVAVNIMCAITATASGTAAIVAPLLGPIYVGMGLDPAIVARTMVTSAVALDSVPYNGTVVFLINGMAHENHRTAYPPLFIMSVVVPFIGTAVCILLGMMFY